MFLYAQNIISESLPEVLPSTIEGTAEELSEEEKEQLRRLAEIKAHQQLVQSLINHTQDIPGLIKQRKIKTSEIPDPHWKKDSCIGCHTEGVEKASELNLRTTNIEKSCMNCHAAEFDHSYIHPVNIAPSVLKLSAMDAEMKKQIQKNNGKVGCSTCHDITLQCKREDRQRHENKKFFRKGPYINRYELCNKCHNSENYQRFNPHEHVTKSGEIIAEKCQVCHSGSIDELKQAESINEVSFHTEKNLEAICWGCHKWKPHPGGQFSFFKSSKGPDHLVKPSDEVLFRIDQTLKEKNILMPLEPETGRVFCATCHNPHAKGVIKNSAAAKGAESKKRLRSKIICNNCHIK